MCSPPLRKRWESPCRPGRRRTASVSSPHWPRVCPHRTAKLVRSSCSNSMDGIFAIRAPRWKLIAETNVPERGPRVAIVERENHNQLYNLEADPGETNNLWAEQPEMAARFNSGSRCDAESANPGKAAPRESSALESRGGKACFRWPSTATAISWRPIWTSLRRPQPASAQAGFHGVWGRGSERRHILDQGPPGELCETPCHQTYLLHRGRRGDQGAGQDFHGRARALHGSRARPPR